MSHCLVISLIKFFATIIFFSLKFSSSSISITEYSMLLLKANALFAGIVHGVVVQIIILEFFKNSLLVSFTLKAA